MQGHADHKQESSGTYAEEPSTTVRPGTHLPDILRRHENRMDIRWVPTSEHNQLLGLAKEQARAATQEDTAPQNIARSEAVTSKGLPENVGRHSKRVDAALPGKHTQKLSERVSPTPDWHGETQWITLPNHRRRVRSVCMWTSKRDRGALPLSMSEVDHAADGHAAMYPNSPRQNIFFLGGKSPLDDQNWKPNLEAVRASIRFATATGRLDAT
ncbi:hypothetical protein N7448_010948 [Penicillium atrosanguineum]|nr:hypothetical protein N7448_010948 [Penicillium atrosanguineum]